MKFIDKFLNSISMYRLMLYYLVFLVSSAIILCFLGTLPYIWTDILISAVYVLVICWITNKLFAKLFKASYNPESTLITALILALILGPDLIILTVAGVSAIASKYLLAWKGRHIFNPAAFGAVFCYFTLNYGATWWIGSLETLPFIFLGSILILRKIKRFQLAGIFFILTLILSTIRSAEFGLNTSYFFDLFYFLVPPILFFNSVMLIEPLTSPYKFRHQAIYAVIVAGAYYFYGTIPLEIPLELALLTGNVFAYIVNGSFRKVLTLKSVKKESADVISFSFRVPDKFKFEPGQFLEWTLAHKNPDSRGVRRFFTIASSPTEDEIILASRFADKSSSFKEALKSLRAGDQIIGSNLAGEFTLPPDPSKKLVFIAGGIGITPFRSMAEYLIDKDQKRDIILLYSNKTEKDIIFRDVFEKAGWKNIYVNTDIDGYIDEELIKNKVPDYKDRHFYLSGPPSMVDAFADLLSKMGIPGNQIRTDFFPGYN